MNKRNNRGRQATTLKKTAWRRLKILSAKNDRTIESMLDEAAFDWLKNSSRPPEMQEHPYP